MFNPDFYERYEYDDSDYEEPVIYSGALSHICDHFEAVLEMLYGEGSIDFDDLERSLDEVAHGLGMRLPMGNLMIRRKVDTNLSQQIYDTNLCQEVNNG